MAETASTTPEIDAEQIAQPPKTATEPKKKAGRPPGVINSPREPVFFDRVAKIPKEDWGTRAFLYCYCTEPICNLKILGENKYLFRSSEPILDLDSIMKDYGSMKGFLSLSLRKTGVDGGNEVDRLNFEIYNPQYPPKIPRKAWLSDPRNDRWAALLPKESEPGSATGMLDAVKLYKEIRSEVKEENAGEKPSELLETMRVAKELFAPATANGTAQPETAKKDPLEIATQLMTIMMQMKADNPMVEILRDQINSLRTELIESRKNVPAPKSIVEQLLEIAASADKIKNLKDLFGGLFGGAAETVVRAGRTSGFDVLKELANSPFGENLGKGLGALLQSVPMMAAGTGAAGPPAIPNPAPGTVTGETDAQRIQRIAMTITNPMINEYFDKGEEGSLFAEHCFNFWPDDYLFIRKLGSDTIVNLYREHNQKLWAYIGQREEKFRKFIGDFCSWEPAKEEEPPAKSDDGFEDKTESEGA